MCLLSANLSFCWLCYGIGSNFLFRWTSEFQMMQNKSICWDLLKKTNATQICCKHEKSKVLVAFRYCSLKS